MHENCGKGQILQNRAFYLLQKITENATQAHKNSKYCKKKARYFCCFRLFASEKIIQLSPEHVCVRVSNWITIKYLPSQQWIRFHGNRSKSTRRSLGKYSRRAFLYILHAYNYNIRALQRTSHFVDSMALYCRSCWSPSMLHLPNMLFLLLALVLLVLVTIVAMVMTILLMLNVFHDASIARSRFGALNIVALC